MLEIFHEFWDIISRYDKFDIKRMITRQARLGQMR